MIKRNKQFGKFYEEIANSVGCGGVSGIKMGEDPPVYKKKKRPTDNDYLADPDEVELKNKKHDEIKEGRHLHELFWNKEQPYKRDWGKILPGTFWDTTLVFASKALYEKLVRDTPVDPKWLVVIAPVALIGRMAEDYFIRYKKYHLQAVKALEDAAVRLRKDAEFRDKVYERIRKQESKLTEAFWDVRNKPYKPWALTVGAQTVGGAVLSAWSLFVYNYFFEEYTPDDPMKWKDLWDTRFVILMALASFLGGASKDYFLRYAKVHVGAANYMNEIVKNWKENAEFREDASNLIKGYYKSLFRATKLTRDVVRYKDRQFEAFIRFRNKWFKENISPAPAITSAIPNKIPVKESAALGTEEWIINNKARFKKRYGKDYKKVLYAHAWNMKNSHKGKLPKDFGQHNEEKSISEMTIFRKKKKTALKSKISRKQARALHAYTLVAGTYNIVRKTSGM